MSPGRPGGQTIVACVVFAEYGTGQVVEVESGPIHIWNGCIETTEDDPAHPPDAAVAYTATAVGVLASVASGGLAGALATGVFGSGFSPDLGAPFNAVFGSGSTTVYTTGPNCLDYQKYYEKQGYTVKQRG